MEDKKLRYTKFGVINSLLSLIPIFPIFTLFPGILIAAFMGMVFNDCELGYSITLGACLAVIALQLFRFFKGIGNHDPKTPESLLKVEFRLFSLGLYSLLNTAILIIFLGTDLACYGDGQTILVCLFSGPIASASILVIGILLDFKLKTTVANKHAS